MRASTNTAAGSAQRPIIDADMLSCVDFIFFINAFISFGFYSHFHSVLQKISNQICMEFSFGYKM